jgi:hypothetical protein
MQRPNLIACTLIAIAGAACSDDREPQSNIDGNLPGASGADNGASNGGGGSSGVATSTGNDATGSDAMGNGSSSSGAGGGASEGISGEIDLDDGAGGSGTAADPDPDGDGAGGGAMAGGAAGMGGMGPDEVELGVFVSTASDSGGDLGGLDGADATCQALADQVGAGSRTWRAYLSTSTIDARARIGSGPWVNANGITVATNLDELHAITGSADRVLVDLFVDHEGNRVNGQWAGSPGPNQHDMLTGSAANGTALANTCVDWTSSTATPGPQVGHSDGLGPGMNPNGNFGSWNSSHAPQGCSQQQLNAVGGAGRFYCFAAD